MLAGRTQSEIPDAADEVIVAAIANGKVYVAEGSITPKVKIAACVAQKKAEPKDDKVRQNSEAAYARCFSPARAATAVLRAGDQTGAGAAGGGDRKIAPAADQYALNRSTLVLAMIRRRASSADRLRMIFIAICGWSWR